MLLVKSLNFLSAKSILVSEDVLEREHCFLIPESRLVSVDELVKESEVAAREEAVNAAEDAVAELLGFGGFGCGKAISHLLRSMFWNLSEPLHFHQ